MDSHLAGGMLQGASIKAGRNEVLLASHPGAFRPRYAEGTEVPQAPEEEEVEEPALKRRVVADP